MNNQAPYINKYLPIVLLYFFANSFLLPHGLLYTTLLTPVGLIWLARYKSFKYLLVFFVLSVVFGAIHFLHGFNLKFYLISLALIFSVYVFALCCYQFLLNCQTLRSLYKQILIVNIIFVAFAIITLPVAAISAVLWYENELTDLYNIRRLKLLTYEASYYSLLLVPIVLYYYLKLIFLKLPNPIITFLLCTIPLVLSLSFGVILGIVISILVTMAWGLRRIVNSRKFFYIFGTSIIVLTAFAVLMLLFPDNFIGKRLARVLSGQDTSFNGRTYDSFYLSWKIAEMKSIWFGAGPGQAKELGLNLFRSFYVLPDATINDVRIPNAAADTLACYGILGLGLRLGIEIWFFFSSKVYRNYYRLALFVFVFFYQFTGSYLTNIIEYTIWLLAFHKGSFHEFESTVHIESNTLEG